MATTTARSELEAAIAELDLLEVVEVEAWRQYRDAWRAARDRVARARTRVAELRLAELRERALRRSADGGRILLTGR